MDALRDWFFANYDWVRAIHILAVIGWMAGLLMMPRLYVYQIQSSAGEPLFDTMSDATRRLRYIILNPAMILAWILGLIMLWVNWEAFIKQPWIHLKLTAVVLMSGLHGWFIGLGRKINRGERPVSEKTLRLVNELPFVLAIIAVIAVVVQIPRLG